MVRFAQMVVLVGTFLASAAPAQLEPKAVSKEDARQWTRYLVPLPKQVEMTASVKLPPAQVAIGLLNAADPLVEQAAKELREALGEAKGPTGQPQAFTVTLQLGGREADRLRKLPHNDQAYLIVPGKGNSGLRLVAIGPRGLYYASKTLQQLAKAKAARGQVELPILTITDWPDMADRGLWGSDSYYQLRWMSDRKMNYDEQISRCGVDEQKQCFVRLNGDKQKIIDEGPTYGINPVPVVLHLEQLSNSGLFKAHPELQGKNAKEGAICYSNPLFTDILSQWLLLWRSNPGVKEIDVWMAENLAGQKGCQCESCSKEDRSVLEAKVIVAAWKKAIAKQPDLGLRVLTSEETEKSNPKVIEQLPPPVKLWYYHSLTTYNTSETPIIRPYLVEAVNRGRWVGVCPNLCARVGFAHPFTGAQFIHYRMNEFVDKRLSGLLGYATPRVYHVSFNVEAAAEWSWNAKGRSPHEFAFSWAVRQGLKDPEKFADWSDTMGPVAWDVYGSEFPSGEKRKRPGKVAGLLKQGKLPELGNVQGSVFPMPWGDIKSVEQLDRDVAQAERAVRTARELQAPMFLQESLVVQGYINSLKALWQLKQLVKPTGVAEADKDAARRHFKAYFDALGQAKATLPAWERTLPSRPGRDRATGETVELLDTMLTEMQAVAADLGCEPK